MASVLAYYELTSWVVLVTALSAAVTSWAEFSETARKTQRYTRAVTSLEVLLSWWASLTVEQSSKAAIANLINTSEQIITEEQMAWTSTAKRAAMQQLTEGTGEGGVAATREQSGGSSLQRLGSMATTD